MPIYPNFYDTQRGDIGKPEYAGDYSIPLLERQDYEQLTKMSHDARAQKIKDGENTFKNLNNLKGTKNNFGFFTLPSLIAENDKLLEAKGINDANYNAAINGDPFMMRKLQAGMLNHGNSVEFLNLASQQQYFNDFTKQAATIKDPNFKSQAYASIAAAIAGEPDPTTGKIMKPTDFNIGQFQPMDLEKSIKAGLDELTIKNEKVTDHDGFQTIDKESVLPDDKVAEFVTRYTSNPAVQRNLTARGLGMNQVDANGNSTFVPNENGKKWISDIIDTHKKSTTDIQSLKFNTKEFNTKGGRYSGGILDSIANQSIISEDTLTTEGNQVVRRTNHRFDTESFRHAVKREMVVNPELRKRILDSKLIDENGEFTDAFKEVEAEYVKKGNYSHINSSKNLPRASVGSKGVDGGAKIKGAFNEAGLDYINVGGLDLSKKVNYRVIASKEHPGKYKLRVGESDKNDIPLKEGVNYRLKAPAAGSINGPAAPPANNKGAAPTAKPVVKSKFFK